MNASTSRRALQGVLTVFGSIAIVAGGSTVLLGVDSIVGAEAVSATVDSEMRFHAVWYLGAGVLLLRAVPRVEAATLMVRGIGALFFLAGCSRALSWMTVGEPHAVAQVLMVVELVLPLVIVPWQKAIAKAD